jgi:hypothetical protein
VQSVLLVRWGLETKAPLIVRATQPAALKLDDPEKSKGRANSVEYAWEDAAASLEKKVEIKGKEKRVFSELTDFNYHFRADGDKIVPEYGIPAGSVRGSLRHAVIKSRIAPGMRREFEPPKLEAGVYSMDELRQRMLDARQRLMQQDNQWRSILTLFGSALDLTPEDDPSLTWAGRLRVETELKTTPPGGMKVAGITVQGGPDNLRRHMTSRNPLDRITHAARDGGLHAFTEMSPGSHFSVNLRILNPALSDWEIVGEWEDDVSEGYLRFGALTSQGRGKVAFVSRNYELYGTAAAPFHSRLNRLADKLELWVGIWKGGEIGAEELTDILTFQKDSDIRREERNHEPQSQSL